MIRSMRRLDEGFDRELSTDLRGNQPIRPADR
jgi:hypothetical protein